MLILRVKRENFKEKTTDEIHAIYTGFFHYDLSKRKKIYIYYIMKSIQRLQNHQIDLRVTTRSIFGSQWFTVHSTPTQEQTG